MHALPGSFHKTFNPFDNEEETFSSSQNTLQRIKQLEEEQTHLKLENEELKAELKKEKKEWGKIFNTVTEIERTVNLHFLQLGSLITSFMSGVNNSTNQLTGEIQRISYQDEVLLTQMKTNSDRVDTLSKLTLQLGSLTGKMNTSDFQNDLNKQ